MCRESLDLTRVNIDFMHSFVLFLFVLLSVASLEYEVRELKER